MSSPVEQIKDRVRIEDVVGEYVKLERAGTNLKARCPFHNEKTPSFFVSPDRGFFYCFGCGAKGDIFSFVERFENLDFPGALKLLADRAGIALEKFSPKIPDKKDRLYALLEEAAKFYERNLAGEEIPKAYLAKRGLSEKTVRDWRIGYVRDEWRTAYDHLKAKGFSDGEMERAGMIKSEKGKTYDRFRGRIMFPIADGAGRVVAFSGRILHDDGTSAKYLNSPQTELFDKSKVLYGYDKAKLAIRKFDFSILVEGQFDEIMCHQAGFGNAVASSGTALTKEHLELLKRITPKIIMSFDSDNAGAKAAERGWALALASGMEVKIAEIPKGYDPADLVLADKEAFKKVLKESKHLVEFLLDKAAAEFSDPKKLWAHVKTHVLPYVALIESSAEQSRHVSRIAEMIGVKEDFIWDDLKKVKLDDEFRRAPSGGEDAVERQVSGEILKKGSEERSLAGILAWRRALKDPSAPGLEGKIADALGEADFARFAAELAALENELVFEAEAYYAGFDPVKMDREIRYLLLAASEDRLKGEAVRISKEIARDADEEKRKALLVRHAEIAKRMERIKKEKVELNR